MKHIKRMKRYLAALLSLLMVFAALTSFAGCAPKQTGDTAGGGGANNTETPEPEEESKRVVYRLTSEVTNYVRINTKGYGVMIVELYPDVAPATVANFQNLVKQGFYNKLTFDRIGSTTIQAGAPTDGTGGTGTTIVGEFSANGFENTLSHTRGVLSMARIEGDYNSASCQFFLCYQDATDNDGEYAAFARVIDGIETLDKLAAVPRNSIGVPLDKPEIVSMRFVYPD